MFKTLSSVLIFTLTFWSTSAHLKQGLEEIFAVLPVQDIKDVTKRFYENDDQVRYVLTEIRGDDDIKFLVSWIEDQLIGDTSEEELEKGQRNFKEISNLFFGEDLVGLTPSTESHDLGGWAVYVKAVGDLIPYEKISEIIIQKLLEDMEFAKSYKLAAEELSGEEENEDKPTYRRWHLKSKLKKAWNKLKKKGVNLSWSIAF